jgi:hypothetical protein
MGSTVWKLNMDENILKRLKELDEERQRLLAPTKRTKQERVQDCKGICPGCQVVEMDSTKWNEYKKQFLVCTKCYNVALACGLNNLQHLQKLITLVNELKSVRNLEGSPGRPG